MKIGICIKYFHENYGGMLQAYATTKVLEKMNIDYEIIRYKKKYNFFSILKSIPRIFNRILLNDKIENFKRKKGLKMHSEYKKNNDIRLNAFHKFKKERFTKLSEEYVGYDNLCKNAINYSVVLSGSDQLWSPAGLPTNFYNLKFVPNNIKKVSYASSFGTSYIPWYQKKRTKEYLKRIEFISMRENRGSLIVKELIGRNVPVVVDPVFLLSRQEWDMYIKPKKIINDKYIFAYFLGDNEEYRKKINEFALKNNLKIVTLRHLDQYVENDEKFGDYAPYDIGPEEFLNIIRYAEYVCTDSFHGTVFSIIYHKKFITFNRYNNKSKHSKNSRIDSLCNNLKLDTRRYIENIDFENAIKKEIDYKTLDKNLEDYIIKSFEYLKNALK